MPLQKFHEFHGFLSSEGNKTLSLFISLHPFHQNPETDTVGFVLFKIAEQFHKAMKVFL